MKSFQAFLNQAWWMQGFIAFSAIGLGWWAQSMSSAVRGMGIKTLVEKSVHGIIFDDVGFSVFLNIFVPSLMYLVSACLVAFLIYHYITTRNLDGLAENLLKWGLSVCLAVICGYMSILGFKLLACAVIILVVCAIMGLMFFVFLRDLSSSEGSRRSQ